MSHKCGCARPQIIIHFEMFGLVWLAIEDHETCMILQVGCVCFFNPFVVYSFGLCTVNLFMHVLVLVKGAVFPSLLLSLKFLFEI